MSSGSTAAAPRSSMRSRPAASPVTARACCRSAAPCCSSAGVPASMGRAVASLVVDRAGSLAAPPQISLIGLAEATRGTGRRAVRRADRGRRGSAGAAAARRRSPARDGAARVAARPQGAIRQAAADRNSACPARGKAMIGRLNHVAIVVPDLAAAASLYRDALGRACLAAASSAGARRHGRVRRAAEHEDRTAGAARDASPVRGFLERTRPAACTMSATRSTT